MDPELLPEGERVPRDDGGEGGEEGFDEREDDRPEAHEDEDLIQVALAELSDASLYTLAEELSLEVPGFRPGRVPRPLLLTHLSRSRDCTPGLILDAYLREHDEVGRLIARSSLKDLKASLPGLVARFGKLPVVLWLDLDQRKGANRLALRLKKGWLDDAEQEATGAVAGRPAPSQGDRPTGGKPRPSPTSPSPSSASAPMAGSASKHQAELARLKDRLRKLEKEKKQAQREAGEAGRALGELRKRVAELEERLASAEKLSESQGPVVVETSAALARDQRLEAAHRQIERLDREVEHLHRENAALHDALEREKEKTARLGKRLDRVALEGPSGSFKACLSFRYIGPDGRFDLRGGYRLLVPASHVHRLDLTDGDLVEVTIVPPDRVELEVLDRRPRREVLGYVERYSPDTWKVVDVQGEEVGWVGDEEARAHGLADGDPVTVMRPELTREGEGRPRLPRVRVLRVHREVRAPTPEEAKAERRSVGGRRSGRARRRRLSREAAPHGRFRELGRPLSGKRVLVVGGDSFHATYRRIVERLGGSFDALKAGDTGRAEAKAMAADIVVVMTGYVSHKVNGRVRHSLERAGRKERLALANSTGHRGLLKALRPFFRQRGA
ncbi:MAG TPA: hypothetical protein DHW14_02060 [Clostridiales bacterium]|nr:hypothetical protein [Clostridiales bacterium]